MRLLSIFGIRYNRRSSLLMRDLLYHDSTATPLILNCDDNDNNIDDNNSKCSDKYRYEYKKGMHAKTSTASVLRIQGLSWVVTAFFIVADMVGGGVVAMPVAFLNTGLFMGILLMLVICTAFAYTGHLLGENWAIMMTRWPEYQEHCRKPYPEIAFRSMGARMKIAASILIYLTIFGTAVVFVLLSSRIVQHLLASIFDIQLSFCYLLVIVCIAIMPLTYLKSPADFWFVIVIAMLCTIGAVILVIIGISFDMNECIKEVYYPPTNVQNIFLSLGTFLFAFSGHHVFPTIQHDMRKPQEFWKSVMLGFMIVALLYMPLSIYGYVVYGGSMENSVIDNVQTTWIRHMADGAIAIHCILTLIIMANPLNQQAEDILKAPHSFGIERVAIRTCVLSAILFCALTVPDFGPFMNLVGSSTIPLVCAVLPTVCNLYLNAMTFDGNTKQYHIPTLREVIKRTKTWKLVLNSIIIICSLVIGLISAALSIHEITLVNFTPPCYLRKILLPSDENSVNHELINCCGLNRDIYLYGNATEICR